MTPPTVNALDFHQVRLNCSIELKKKNSFITSYQSISLPSTIPTARETPRLNKTRARTSTSTVKHADYTCSAPRYREEETAFISQDSLRQVIINPQDTVSRMKFLCLIN